MEELQALELALVEVLALAEVLDSVGVLDLGVVLVEASTAMVVGWLVVLAMGVFSLEVKSKPCRTSMTVWPTT